MQSSSSTAANYLNSANSKSSLFVGDLSIFCTENDLAKVFSSYGAVLEAKVMRCEETNKNLCYGFVKFAAPNAAIKAMQEMNGKLLCGRPLRISWASHKIRKGATGPMSVSDGHGNNSSSIHVNYSTNQIDKMITEDNLRKVFNKYGEVLDITVKKFELDKENKTQRGYGFVHFPPNVSGILSSLKCTEELRDTSIDDIHFKCEVSHKLVKQLLAQQDPEVINLIQKYFPGGLEELKEKDQNIGQTLVHVPNGLNHGVNEPLTIQTTFPEVSVKERVVGKRQPRLTPGAPVGTPYMPHHTLSPVYPPYYNGVPFYGYDTMMFDQRMVNPLSSSTLPSSSSESEFVTGTETTVYNQLTGSFSTTQNILEANQTRTDSDSGDSATTNIYTYREQSQNMTYPTSYYPSWPSNSLDTSFYSSPFSPPLPWPSSNSFLLPYFSLPGGGSVAPMPFMVSPLAPNRSPPSYCDYGSPFAATTSNFCPIVLTPRGVSGKAK